MLFKALPYTNLKQSFYRQTRHHLYLTELKIKTQRVASPRIIDRGGGPKAGLASPSHHRIPNSKYVSCSAERRTSATPTGTGSGETPQKRCHSAGCTLFSTPPCAGCNQAESAGGPALPWGMGGPAPPPLDPALPRLVKAAAGWR